MQKKNYIIFAVVLAILLLASVLVFLKQPETVNLNKSAATSSAEPNSQALSSAAASSATDTTLGSATNEPVEQTDQKIIKNKEDLKVSNNSLEYDMKAIVYENELSETFLRLEYYTSGASTIKELSTEEIPQLDKYFEKKPSIIADTVNPVPLRLYLNSKYSRLYIIAESGIEPRVGTGDINTAVYSFNLKDVSLKKLLDDKCILDGFSLNKSFGYLAFTYGINGLEKAADTSLKSGNSGAHYLQIIDCATDVQLVNRNLYKTGKLIGKNTDTAAEYYYSLLSWSSNDTLKLKEFQAKKDVVIEQEVLYNIEKDELSRPNQPKLSDNQADAGQDAVQTKVESDPVKTLRQFYTYLTSNNQYFKAYNMLDDDFVIKLKLLEQFGVEQLSKSDMDLSSFPIYASIFRTARLDRIIDEQIGDKESTIYYYQIIAMGDGSEITEPLVVSLKQDDKGWKVLSVSDGNIDEKPFK